MLEWMFREPLPAGTAAPDFSLPDETGRVVRLADFRGAQPVALVWYPGDATRVCTQQLCELRDNWPALEKAGLAVFGVNPQAAERHQAFRAQNAFPFPLLVDAGQQVGKLYHTDGWIVRRTVYVIDREGVIRLAERGRPTPERILEALGL